MRQGPSALCIAAAAALLLAACREAVVHELKEAKANEVVVALAESGIAAEKLRDGSGWSVTAPGGRAAEAMRLISRQRLLRSSGREVEQPRKSLVSTREERAHFLQRSSAAALEETLLRMPGILDARVHLHNSSMPPGMQTNGAAESSASILLIVEPSDKVDKAQAALLVVGASGVPAEQVRVIAVYSRSAAGAAARSAGMRLENSATSSRPGKAAKQQHSDPTAAAADVFAAAAQAGGRLQSAAAGVGDGREVLLLASAGLLCLLLGALRARRAEKSFRKTVQKESSQHVHTNGVAAH